MQYRCELVDYKVSKFEYDANVRNKEKKNRTAQFENKVKISIRDEKGTVVIETRMVDDLEEIKYFIEMRGVFEFVHQGLVEAEKENILKEEGFKILYLKLNEVFEGIKQLTRQKLPELPDYADIIPLE